MSTFTNENEIAIKQVVKVQLRNGEFLVETNMGFRKVRTPGFQSEESLKQFLEGYDKTRGIYTVVEFLYPDSPIHKEARRYEGQRLEMENKI